MKRILLIGNSPLPEENTRTRPAAGLRTWQFLKGLEGKFDLRLATIAMPECYEGASEAAGRASEVRASGHVQISKNDPELLQKLQKLHDEFHPDVIIAVNTYPSYIAAGLKSLAPLWSDLNGWIMAEAQAQAFKMDSNDYLAHYFEMEKKIVEAADKFSAVSKAECFALYGELAALGRLNKESFGYKFVEHVPNGIEWLESEKMAEGSGNRGEEHKHGGVHTNSDSVPGNAFVLLWVGGYNTWVDEMTLFKAVSEAMAKCPNLYFVSTGGGLSGLDGRTFEKFKKMIEESEWKNRFVFLGWVETSEMPTIYARAQAGINVDRRCVETMTGARNRINEMMKFGLPVVTTLGSEIAEEVRACGAGIAVKSGDHGAVAAAITKMYGEWRGGGGRETKEFMAYGRAGMDYIKTRCNYETTLAPLLAWLENPRPAPDRNVNVEFGGASLSGAGKVLVSGAKRGLAKSRMLWRYLRENGFKKSFQKFLQKLM
ncbi:glycosyltransferase [Candidatus Peregrinibacteria bacterium]|nr:glycosyltransferase [Candidatus Peregrinibacteria bacterium]